VLLLDRSERLGPGGGEAHLVLPAQHHLEGEEVGAPVVDDQNSGLAQSHPGAARKEHASAVFTR
jgi:hypothetical protein